MPNRAVLPWLLVLPMLVAAALSSTERRIPRDVSHCASTAGSLAPRACHGEAGTSRLGAGRLSLRRCLSRSGCSSFHPARARWRFGVWRLRWWCCAGDGSGECRPGRCSLVLAVCGVAAFKERLLPLKDVRPLAFRRGPFGGRGAPGETRSRARRWRGFGWMGRSRSSTSTRPLPRACRASVAIRCPRGVSQR